MAVSGCAKPIRIDIQMSNSAGIFYPFIDDASVKLIGVEAGGRGSALGQHAATLSQGSLV